MLPDHDPRILEEFRSGVPGLRAVLIRGLGGFIDQPRPSTIGDIHLPMVREASRDPAPDVRKASVEHALHCGNDACIQEVVRLAKEDIDPDLRRLAYGTVEAWWLEHAELCPPGWPDPWRRALLDEQAAFAPTCPTDGR